MRHYRTISEYNSSNGLEAPANPLLHLLDCALVNKCDIMKDEFTADFYLIMFKKVQSGVILYGRTEYDHDNGSMSFIKPRQAIQFKNVELEESGFIVVIHEDYLHGHNLHNDIKKYGYFDYEANEALHLSPREEQVMLDLFAKMLSEHTSNPDEYSREIILSHVDTMLKYSQRFYKRQFINRTTISGKTVSKFNQVLATYFEDEKLRSKGLPTVKAIADSLKTSPRYLSDLLRQETGKTAMELIHIFLIGEAKNMLQASENTISETAYFLGFENPPYFSRLFKKEVGLTPVEFRKQFLN
ncbi:MAG: AraC family transcriptional regulator [Flavobacterium psychrophilum]|nr:MAG: AraC family transcriptional regulator [Flavobacterium psychrophilum]